jgi:hypothetical protein
MFERKRAEQKCSAFVAGHDVCYFGRFQDKSEHDLLQRTCPLLTQSGHRPLPDRERAG